MKVQLTFRSGAQVTVDVERMQVTYDGPAGKITRIQWNDADDGNRPLGIVTAEVVAVVELDAAPADNRFDHYYGTPSGNPLAEHPAHSGMTCGEYHNQREAERR